MITQEELDLIKRCAEQKQAGFLEENPGTQVPPDEGTETLSLVAEIERLTSMLQYALAAPDDSGTIKSILFDALNGCSGADNMDEVRARYGAYRSPLPVADGAGDSDEQG